MNDEQREYIKELLKNADPELLAKYGNPLDENDPRFWTPTKRIENGISTEDQLKYLALDIEALSFTLANTLSELHVLKEWATEQMKKEFVQLAKEDPKQAVEKLLEMLGGKDGAKGAYGPLDPADPNGPVRYAGSTEGAAPTQMVDTPNGLINVQDIPGYVNDPNWKPSPDWVEANCMCENHVRMREASNGHRPDDDFPKGFYL